MLKLRGMSSPFNSAPWSVQLLSVVTSQADIVMQVFLKIMKHSTDSLPPPPQASLQQDRNAPPPTALSSHPDAVGVLLGLDLEGVMEVEDCFALPSGETSLGGELSLSSLFGLAHTTISQLIFEPPRQSSERGPDA